MEEHNEYKSETQIRIVRKTTRFCISRLRFSHIMTLFLCSYQSETKKKDINMLVIMKHPKIIIENSLKSSIKNFG